MAVEKPPLTPINEVVSPFVQVNLPLPASLADRIGMNVGRVENICHWVGINKLVIVGTNEFQAQDGIPNIGSVSIHGEAGAVGYAQATKDDEIDVQEEKNNRYMSYRKCNALLTTNLRDIERGILKKDKAVTDPSTWAQSIDATLRRELVRSAYRHMIKNAPKKEIYDLIGPVMYSTIIASELSKMTIQPSSDIGTISFFSGLWALITTMTHMTNKLEDSKATFSVLPKAVQFDRFGVAVAKTIKPGAHLIQAIS